MIIRHLSRMKMNTSLGTVHTYLLRYALMMMRIASAMSDCELQWLRREVVPKMNTATIATKLAFTIAGIKTKETHSSMIVRTTGNGGRQATFAGDFWTGWLSVWPSGFWNVYTVSGGLWWLPFSYAVDMVCGLSRDVTGSCEWGGHVDTACVWFVAVDAY